MSHPDSGERVTTVLDFPARDGLAVQAIRVDYAPGEVKEVTLHDGSKIVLKKLDASHDPTDRMAAIRRGENFAESLKSVVVDTTTYDWEGDKPLNRPFVGTVIYELHVAGFTRRPNSGVAAEKRNSGVAVK